MESFLVFHGPEGETNLRDRETWKSQTDSKATPNANLDNTIDPISNIFEGF